MDSLLHSFTALMYAVVIPCVAIIGGISYAAYSMYLRVRSQREALQMYHAERMAAIDKGIELPPLPPALLHDRYYGGGYPREYRRWRRGRGVTLVLIGVAATVAMWQANGDRSFWWGLIIIAWGVGRLVSEYLETSGVRPQAGDGGPLPPGSPPNR